MQVDYVYPEFRNVNLNKHLPVPWLHLLHLALPDGVHNYDGGMLGCVACMLGCVYCMLGGATCMFDCVVCIFDCVVCVLDCVVCMFDYVVCVLDCVVCMLLMFHLSSPLF